MESPLDRSKRADLSPMQNRADLRVCHVRAIEPTEMPDGAKASLLEILDLGRLSNSVRTAADFAPQVASLASRSTVRLRGVRWEQTHGVAWQRFRLFVPPSRLIDVRVFSTKWTSLADAMGLLEDLSYESIEDEPTEWDAEYLPGSANLSVTNLEPFHQLVFIPDDHEEPDWEAIQRLVYRADLDAIEEQSSIRHPDELNRRPNQLAAVGRFGSVLWGLQDYLEASLIVSAALGVSATSTVRAVQRQAREHLLTARDFLTSGGGRSDDQNDLRRAIATLGIDLAIGAEAQANIVDVLPSLRVDAFHQALYDASDLQPQIKLARGLLDRADAAIDAAQVDG